MKIVQAFCTEDGQVFYNKNAAVMHELESESGAKLREVLKQSINTGRPESIIKQLLMESGEVLQVLTMFHKKQSRIKKDDVTTAQS